MKNIQNISIVLTFFALWSSNFFDTRMEMMAAFILVFSLGILHGANDIKIIQKVQSRRSSFVKTLILYILTVVGAGVVFFFLPQVALFVFIVISAYHFGEQHFHNIKIESELLRYVLFASYGFSVLFLLLFCNSAISQQVIEQITRIQVDEQYFLWIAGISFILLVTVGVILTLKGILKSWYKELFYLLVLYILFESSSLIWGFAIYFVFWHSLPSLLDQVNFLSGTVESRSMWSYVKSSLLYWILSLLGLSVFVILFKDNDQYFITLFFTFLAAITFPHVVVMHRLFNKKD